MKYILKDSNTDKELFTAYCSVEMDDHIEREQIHPSDYYILQIHSCRGCQEDKDDVQERSDAHGIFTGHYCDDCYENNYPYRKDFYPTIETHGYGERLDDNY